MKLDEGLIYEYIDKLSIKSLKEKLNLRTSEMFQKVFLLKSQIPRLRMEKHYQIFMHHVYVTGHNEPGAITKIGDNVLPVFL